MKFLQTLKSILAHRMNTDQMNKEYQILKCFDIQHSSFNILRFPGVIFAILLVLQPAQSFAQSFSRTITKTAEFADHSDTGNTFSILNINGPVIIEAYDGETVQLTVTEHFEGTSAEIERAQKEFEYKLERKDNIIIAWLDTPFTDLEYDDGEYEYDWDGDWNDRNYNDFSFTHKIHVRVPRNILIATSTMNGDSVSITGSFKRIKAENMNGDVVLKDITSQVFASTLNGDVVVSYKKAPPADSKFETLNGNIDVSVPENVSADIYFESLRGDFYTDFENLQYLEQEVRESREGNLSSITYRVDGFSPVRIGDGDIELRFEVLNGDVFLRKQ